MNSDQQKETAVPASDAGTADRQLKEKMAKYNEVVRRAELSVVHLVSVSFKVDPRYHAEKAEKDSAERKNGLKLSVGVKVNHVVVDNGSGVAGVFLLCEVGAKLRKSNLLTCKAEYFVGYRNLNGCDEKASEAFLNRVGKFSCYPYFRSLFASLDWSAGTEMPPLPVLRESVVPRVKELE
jgi:hypothetical protein